MFDIALWSRRRLFTVAAAMAPMMIVLAVWGAFPVANGGSMFLLHQAIIWPSIGALVLAGLLSMLPKIRRATSIPRWYFLRFLWIVASLVAVGVLLCAALAAWAAGWTLLRPLLGAIAILIVANVLVSMWLILALYLYLLLRRTNPPAPPPASR